MTIFDLFSKRQRRARGEVPDVYQYEKLPQPFRVQVVHILADLFGAPEHDEINRDIHFRQIHNALCREYGKFMLSKLASREEWRQAVFEFILETQETEKVLDAIELSFRKGIVLGEGPRFQIVSRPTIRPQDLITELNERFRQHGIGYQFESGEIVRVDSQVLHAEAVKPALQLLADTRFAGANAEFLKAHEHYRHGRNSECLNECLKALESVLKIICKKQKWQFKERDTAKGLFDVVYTNGLVPSWLQTEFGSLRATLESGVPTVRNRMSGHGQGANKRIVPDYVAAYLLHLSAAAILFLVGAEREILNNN